MFFRINTITLEIPPLRERPEDIPLLSEHFLAVFADRPQRDVRSIHPSAQDALLRHSWPGNVRELEHIIERAVIIAGGAEIQPGDLPDILEQSAAAAGLPAGEEDGELTLAAIERQAILRTLERTNGNKRAAASILGVYRPTLYGKLRKYKLGEYGDSPKAPRKPRQAGESGTSESTTDAEEDPPAQGATRP